MVAAAATTMTWRETLRRIPTVSKAAVAIGVLGWFFSLGGSTTTTINGVSYCDGTDIGPLVVAGVVGVLRVVGLQRVRSRAPGRGGCRAPCSGAGVVVLAAIVAVHVLRVVD